MTKCFLENCDGKEALPLVFKDLQLYLIFYNGTLTKLRRCD